MVRTAEQIVYFGTQLAVLGRLHPIGCFAQDVGDVKLFM